MVIAIIVVAAEKRNISTTKSYGLGPFDST
jgi:hypothetical protein